MPRNGKKKLSLAAKTARENYKSKMWRHTLRLSLQGSRSGIDLSRIVSDMSAAAWAAGYFFAKCEENFGGNPHFNYIHRCERKHKLHVSAGKNSFESWIVISRDVGFHSETIYHNSVPHEYSNDMIKEAATTLGRYINKHNMEKVK